jgi:acetylornithine deacetylase/succinyl-diaminopimelate desuccinylase-like protein
MTDANAPLDTVLAHVDSTIDDSVARLFDLLRIASISTDPAYKDECRKAADWLSSELSGLGFDASVRPTTGHPMVVGHAKIASGPNVLFYGH